MPELSITIPGKPIAKKRPKFFRRGGFVGTYNCQETEEGRAMQQLSMQCPENWKPVEVAISLSVDFLMPIPDSQSKKKRDAMARGEIRHTKKPDIDNLLKFVKERLVFVFQEFLLIPTLSAIDNVLLPLIPHGIKKSDRERAVKLLTQVRLENRIKHKPNQLSGGEKQRVAIARALINDPSIMFADEPTGAAVE